jgi:hypothetical protein
MTQNIFVHEQWQNFFLIVGSGAATLTGLLVVAISPHLEAIIKDSSLRHRALSILAGLGAAFMRCSLVLMGGQNHIAVGFELFVGCLIAMTIGARSFIHASKHSRVLHKNIYYRSIITMGCYAIEMLGALSFMNGYLPGLYVAAITMVATFYFLISGSWLLLMGISRDEENI